MASISFNKPLVCDLRNVIHKNLSFEKRFLLTKRCPVLRDSECTLPYRFDEFGYPFDIDNTYEIDSFYLSFTSFSPNVTLVKCDTTPKYLEKKNQRSYAKLFYLSLTLPKSRAIELMLRFLADRPGTRCRALGLGLGDYNRYEPFKNKIHAASTSFMEISSWEVVALIDSNGFVAPDYLDNRTLQKLIETFTENATKIGTEFRFFNNPGGIHSITVQLVKLIPSVKLEKLEIKYYESKVAAAHRTKNGIRIEMSYADLLIIEDHTFLVMKIVRKGEKKLVNEHDG